MFSMKKILAIAGAGAMLVSVAACGSGTAGDDGGKKEISFQTWNLKNDKYTIAMARTNDPHSATSQFFINVADNDFLNHTSPTPRGWGYAVFGKVVAGTDVVDAIAAVRTASRSWYGDVHVEDVVMEKVEEI